MLKALNIYFVEFPTCCHRRSTWTYKEPPVSLNSAECDSGCELLTLTHLVRPSSQVEKLVPKPAAWSCGRSAQAANGWMHIHFCSCCMFLHVPALPPFIFFSDRVNSKQLLERCGLKLALDDLQGSRIQIHEMFWSKPCLRDAELLVVVKLRMFSRCCHVIHPRTWAFLVLDASWGMSYMVRI